MNTMLSGWPAPPYIPPRRSQDQPPPENAQQSPPSPSSNDNNPDAHRSSTDATPRPSAATTRFLSSSSMSVVDQDPNSANNSTHTGGNNRPVLANDIFSSSKRLGFLTDKLASSLSGTASQKSSSHLLHPHNRTDSTLPSTPLNASNLTANSASGMNASVKAHASPSKSHGRTYDPKVVSREMQRLGNIPHLPAQMAPSISTSSSVASLSASVPITQATVNPQVSTDPWKALHVVVLPLFNGEPLKCPIEDLNVLVKRHIQSSVSSSPSKALLSLEADAVELIGIGMVTLNGKLLDVDDEKLIGRVVEVWRFFWDQVLTYLEGVLLPLQTDPLLLSLSTRGPKSHRGSSPSRRDAPTSLTSSTALSQHQIDIRTLALRSFRDRVILPLFTRLCTHLSPANANADFQEMSTNHKPRLQQMLLVLHSQSRSRPAPSLSLATPPPQPTAGEAAITELLRLVRAPTRSPWSGSNLRAGPGQTQGPGLGGGISNFRHGLSIIGGAGGALNTFGGGLSGLSGLSRAPTFLSGAQPRDRRGRIAQKQGRKSKLLQSMGLYNLPDGSGELEKEKDRSSREGPDSPGSGRRDESVSAGSAGGDETPRNTGFHSHRSGSTLDFAEEALQSPDREHRNDIVVDRGDEGDEEDNYEDTFDDEDVDRDEDEVVDADEGDEETETEELGELGFDPARMSIGPWGLGIGTIPEVKNAGEETETEDEDEGVGTSAAIGAIKSVGGEGGSTEKEVPGRVDITSRDDDEHIEIEVEEDDWDKAQAEVERTMSAMMLSSSLPQSSLSLAHGLNSISGPISPPTRSQASQSPVQTTSRHGHPSPKQLPPSLPLPGQGQGTSPPALGHPQLPQLQVQVPPAIGTPSLSSSIPSALTPSGQLFMHSPKQMQQAGPQHGVAQGYSISASTSTTHSRSQSTPISAQTPTSVNTAPSILSSPHIPSHGPSSSVYEGQKKKTGDQT